jgi:ubiquitin-protein ligase
MADSQVAACSARLAKVLTSQYAKFSADPYPHLLAAPNEANIREWHFLAGGLDAPFMHGEYMFRLTAPDDYPASPPRFEFLTPSGVYMPGGPICISVGEFHTNDDPGASGAYGWRPCLGMKGFAIQVVNGLICHAELGWGIRIQNLPPILKQKFARDSRAHNIERYPELYQVFESIIEACPDDEPVRNITDARIRLQGGIPPSRGAPLRPAEPLLAEPTPHSEPAEPTPRPESPSLKSLSSLSSSPSASAPPSPDLAPSPAASAGPSPDLAPSPLAASPPSPRPLITATEPPSPVGWSVRRDSNVVAGDELDYLILSLNEMGG